MQEAGLRAISAANDPGRLGLTGYTYSHVPMVAGIIATAAGRDDDRPPDRSGDDHGGHADPRGPALYLVGQVLFKWGALGSRLRSRLIAVGALVTLVPLTIVSSSLVLMAATTMVLVIVALWMCEPSACEPFPAERA